MNVVNEIILVPHSCILEQGYFHDFKWKCKIEFNYNEISGCSFPLSLYHSQDFPVAQMVKNLPAMQETRVQSLRWEEFLEKGMAIHSSILAWRIPQTQKIGGLRSMGSQRVRHD